jgi:hypothetical protein
VGFKTSAAAAAAADTDTVPAQEGCSVKGGLHDDDDADLELVLQFIVVTREYVPTPPSFARRSVFIRRPHHPQLRFGAVGS